MQILLVVPLFPPDKGVSTLRSKFFYNEMSKKHEVDILKFGDKTDLDGHIKTIDKKKFGSFIKAIKNYFFFRKKFELLFKNYDIIIVSVPQFSLLLLTFYSESKSKIILDLRDLPEMNYYDSINKHPKLKIFYYIKYLFLKFFMHLSIKRSKNILCVGSISAALLQQKYKNVSITNVHNGYESKDVILVRNLFESNFSKNKFTDNILIGWVGSIHDFRDTKKLRDALMKINKLNKQITIKHWGFVSPKLKTFIFNLKNINYVQEKILERKLLLKELASVDVFLLACSDKLIWEPTTTVFDYILFDKPVIFIGLPNNEAYNILQISNINIIKPESLEKLNFNKTGQFNTRLPLVYSREYNFAKLNEILSNNVKG